MEKDNQQVQKGKRINGKKASLNSFSPMYDFLLFDPKYREMKEKTKILYGYLRKKAEDWKYITEQAEAGEEGFTKTYRDDNGDIYVIADNVEISIVLQCHINRVKTYRDELEKYGLLESIPRFQQSHLLYVLIPDEDELTPVWTHIEEMKTIRESLEKENKEKALKRKQKQKAKKEQDKIHNQQNVSYEESEKHNSQNVSYNNQQNVSYNNSQNVGENQSKGFKSNLNSSKTNLNLSIYHEHIVNIDIPDVIKKIIEKQIDRLIFHNINLKTIELNYNANKDRINESAYAEILNRALIRTEDKIGSMDNYMNTSINKHLANQNMATEAKQVKSNEVLPDWFKEKRHKEQQAKNEQKKEQKPMSAEQKRIAERLKAYTAN